MRENEVEPTPKAANVDPRRPRPLKGPVDPDRIPLPGERRHANPASHEARSTDGADAKDTGKANTQ